MIKISLSKENRVQKIFLVAIVANLLIVGLYAYLYFDIQRNNNVIVDLDGSINDLKVQRDDLRSAKSNISATASLREKINNYFVPKDGLVPFLDDIHSLGRENNLATKIVSVVPEIVTTAPESIESLHMVIEVAGSWSDVYRYATLVELLPYKVSVNRISIQRNFDTGSLPKNTIFRPWKGTIDVSILKLK